MSAQIPLTRGMIMPDCFYTQPAFALQMAQQMPLDHLVTDAALIALNHMQKLMHIAKAYLQEKRISFENDGAIIQAFCEEVTKQAATMPKAVHAEAVKYKLRFGPEEMHPDWPKGADITAQWWWLHEFGAKRTKLAMEKILARFAPPELSQGCCLKAWGVFASVFGAFSEAALEASYANLPSVQTLVAAELDEIDSRAREASMLAFNTLQGVCHAVKRYFNGVRKISYDGDMALWGHFARLIPQLAASMPIQAHADVLPHLAFSETPTLQQATAKLLWLHLFGKRRTEALMTRLMNIYIKDHIPEEPLIAESWGGEAYDEALSHLSDAVHRATS